MDLKNMREEPLSFAVDSKILLKWIMPQEGFVM
jgi:hypothetical protein